MTSFALTLSLILLGGCPPPGPRSCPTSQPVDPAALTEVERAAPRPEKGAAPAAAAPSQNDGDLVLQNTPPIPHSLRRRFGQYLESRNAGFEGLSDDGKKMLVSTRFGQTYQLHLLDRPMGARRQITFAAEPVKEASFLPGSDRSLLFKSDIGGNEAYQIFRLDLNTGKTALLTDGKSRHGDYLWSHDGKQIAYTSNARNGKDMDLYLGDGRSRSSQRLLLEREGHWFPVDFSHDGKQLLVGRYISINESRLFVVDIATKKVTRITPDSPAASYRQALFDRSGKKIYVTTDRLGEFVELYELDLAKKQWRPLTRDTKWNVTDLALSPSGKTLAFVVNEDGYGALNLLDTRRRRHRKVKTLPPGIVTRIGFARRAEILGLSAMGPARAGDTYTYDVKRGKLTRWTGSEVGGLNPARFVKPTLFHYETFDGKKIPCFYYRPPGPRPHPTLLFIHGGPEAQARPHFRALVQYLVAESGIAVLHPNVRGSDGYGKSSLLLDNGFKREDSVKDIGALLDWVKGRPELDEKRVGVLGGSYGGYMVLAALVHYADRIAAGVDIVGISNFVTFLKNTKSYRRDLRRAEYGDERDPKMKAFLEKISPSNNVSKIRSALFVAHGANDPRVPLSETDQIVEAVRKQGKDVWYMVAKNEGHGFRKKKNRNLFYFLTVMFFQKHLRAGR